MDFFGIGTPELLLILLIFFIFFGPTKLPEIAAMMGKAMRKIRQASAEMNKNLQEISDEVQETSKETGRTVSGEKGLVQEFKDVSKELGDAARDVTDSAKAPAGLKNNRTEIPKEIPSSTRETGNPAKPKEVEAAKNPNQDSQS